MPVDYTNMDKSDPRYKARLAYLRKWKKQKYQNNQTYREKLIAKVEEYRKKNPEKYREYYKRTNSKRKLDPSLFELHRLIIDLENAARA